MRYRALDGEGVWERGEGKVQSNGGGRFDVMKRLKQACRRGGGVRGSMWYIHNTDFIFHATLYE